MQVRGELRWGWKAQRGGMRRAGTGRRLRGVRDRDERRGAGLGPQSPWVPQDWGVRCSQSPWFITQVRAHGSLHKWDSFITDLWKHHLLYAFLFFHSWLQPLKISLWPEWEPSCPLAEAPQGGTGRLSHGTLLAIEHGTVPPGAVRIASSS